jgi:hypothetical protein
MMTTILDQKQLREKTKRGGWACVSIRLIVRMCIVPSPTTTDSWHRKMQPKGPKPNACWCSSFGPFFILVSSLVAVPYEYRALLCLRVLITLHLRSMRTFVTQLNKDKSLQIVVTPGHKTKINPFSLLKKFPLARPPSLPSS